MVASTSQPVWAKRVGDNAGEAHVRYCAGRDVVGRPPADSLLVEADLWTNRAHAVMLAQQEILRPDQARAILTALDDIAGRAAKGEFVVPPEAEDVHMAVEQDVTRLAGPGAGGWLHAGRSRNDQTATDCRLWLRERILDIANQVAGFVGALLKHADAHRETVCPGFTHMQPAMVTTWGHVVSCWAQALLRDLERLADAFRMANRSPLGAAASFGTSWPIDRELTARLLGFDTVQANSLDAVSSRGELEAQSVAALVFLVNHLSGIGQDLMLLSSPPRQWVRIDDRFVTGSSIMPQKRNPDFAEVTRAKSSTVTGMLTALLGIGRAAPAGYHRDTQWTKYLAMDAFAEVEGAPLIFQGVIETLRIDAEKMRAACAVGFMNAAEVAEALAAATRLPFRACYQKVGQAVAACDAAGELRRDTLNKILADDWSALRETLGPRAPTKPYQFDETAWASLSDPLGLVKRRDQAGSPNPDRVAQTVADLREALRESSAWFARQAINLDAARQELRQEIEQIVGGPRNA